PGFYAAMKQRRCALLPAEDVPLRASVVGLTAPGSEEGEAEEFHDQEGNRELIDAFQRRKERHRGTSGRSSSGLDASAPQTLVDALPAPTAARAAFARRLSVSVSQPAELVMGSNVRALMRARNLHTRESAQLLLRQARTAAYRLRS